MTSRFLGWRTAIEALPQRVRRVVAVAALAGLPAGFAWSALWQGTSVNRWVWGPAWILFGAATGFGALVLYTYVRDRANRDARLDERQRQLRDSAWIISYQVLAAVVVAVVVVLAVLVLGFGKTITLDWQVASDTAILTGVLLPLLPAAALAWVEPDPPAEA